MLKNMILTTSFVVLTLTSAFAAEIKIGGGGASIATIFNPIKAPFEKSTGDSLVILQSTPKNGLIDLEKKVLDAAVSAVSLSGVIEAAAKDGVNATESSLTVTKVGANKTVVFLNKANTVTPLTKEQLKDIFTGKIQNWKEVGGADSEILVVWGKNSPGQNALFQKVILDGEKPMADVLETTDYKGIMEAVVANPGAIGIDPLGMGDDTVKVIKPVPEVSSDIILITKGAPSPGVRKLIDFISKEGKRYIKE